MADDYSPSLREALEASYSAAEVGGGSDAAVDRVPAAQDAHGVEDAAVPQPARGVDGSRERDAAGRFASRAASGATPEPSAPSEPVAPEGYNPDLWAQLTPEARRATADWAGKTRETLAEREARLASYAPIDRVLDKRRNALTASFGGVDRALEQLFHLSDWAATDFPGFVRHLAQQRGIDLSSIVQGADGQQAQAAPRDPAADIRQLVADVVREQTLSGQVDRDYETFANDQSLPHRNDGVIRQTMAALLQANIARDYPDAYHRAVQAHPEFGPKLRAAEAAAAAKAETERAAKAAGAKASAAVSVTGAPGTSRAAAGGTPPPSPRAALEAAWAALSGPRA